MYFQIAFISDLCGFLHLAYHIQIKPITGIIGEQDRIDTLATSELVGAYTHLLLVGQLARSKEG